MPAIILRLLLLIAALTLTLPAAAAEENSAASPPDPRRPTAIEATGVPAVPPELFAELLQYRNIRQGGFAGWSPDGRGILLRTTFGNTAQLHRVYTPGGRREQVTFFDEPVRGGFVEGTKDGSLLLAASRGGSENDQLYLLDGATRKTILLTDGKSRNSFGPVRHDGRMLVLGSNRRNGTDTDLYLVDLAQRGEPQMLMQVESQFWGAADWSHDGKRLALRRYVSATQSYAAIFDIEEKRRIDLPLPGPQPVSFGAIRFRPDGAALYLAHDAGGEFQSLHEYDLATEKYRPLAADIPWDVEEIEVEPKSGAVAFTVNADGATQLFVWRNGARRQLEVPLGVISSIEWSPDGEQLGFTLVRGDAPADAFSIVVADGQLTQWSYSEIGGLDPTTLVAPKQIRFRSFDDREIPAWYYPGRGASPQSKAPVYISIHGGPESQYQPSLSGGTQYLAGQLGVAVIYPNVRGSSGYGKTYLELDNGFRREDSVRDIGALLDWIEAQPELDASRVAVGGGSYGGYMTLASLTHYPERLRAGVNVVGIANFITFLESTAPYRRDLRRPEYGDERDPKMREFLLRISPVTNAHKIDSALLVAHGKNDPRVPFAEAEQIAEKVREAGQTVWTVYAENEGHGFARRDNGEYLQAVQILFLREQLGIK